MGWGRERGGDRQGVCLARRIFGLHVFFHIVTTIQGLEEKCRNLFHNTANRVAQMFTMSGERMHKIYRKKIPDIDHR